MAKEKALAIIKRLRDEKHQAFLAGGCVRDDLLGKVPKDYDIATDAQPGEVQRIFPQTIPLGTQFGVVLVVLEGESFAVTTFRFDGPYLVGVCFQEHFAPTDGLVVHRMPITTQLCSNLINRTTRPAHLDSHPPGRS